MIVPRPREFGGNVEGGARLGVGSTRGKASAKEEEDGRRRRAKRGMGTVSEVRVTIGWRGRPETGRIYY